MERRTVLKGMAWSVPVIAVTAAVPMAAASGDCGSVVHVYNPRDYSDNNWNPSQNAAKITVAVGSHIEVEFIRGIDHPHVNIDWDGKGTQNFHYPRRVSTGEKFTFPLDDCLDPKWIQVGGNNIHYYRGGVFRN